MIPTDHDHEGPPDYEAMAERLDEMALLAWTKDYVPEDERARDAHILETGARFCREQATKDSAEDSVPTRQELAAAARAATGHTQATHVAAVIEAQMIDRKLATPSRARLVAAWVAEQGGKAK